MHAFKSVTYLKRNEKIEEWNRFVYSYYTVKKSVLFAVKIDVISLLHVNFRICFLKQI